MVVAWAVLSHYVVRRCLNTNWTLKTKIQCNSIKKSFHNKNEFENVAREGTALFVVPKVLRYKFA